MKKQDQKLLLVRTHFSERETVQLTHKKRGVVSFLWETFEGKNECFLVSSLKQWQCRIGQSNYKDLIHCNYKTDFRLGIVKLVS